MIKINLNQTGKVTKAGARATGTGESADGELGGGDTRYQMQGALRIFIILLFPIGLYFYEQQSLPLKHAELNSRQALLAELTRKNQEAAGALEETTKYKVDYDRLNLQVGIIDDLKKSRMQEVKVLDSLQKIIPVKVWLSRIEIGSGRVDLQGMTTTDQGLTSFMDALASSVFLKDISLIKSQETNEDPNLGSVKRFEITSQLEKIQ